MIDDITTRPRERSGRQRVRRGRRCSGGGGDGDEDWVGDR